MSDESDDKRYETIEKKMGWVVGMDPGSEDSCGVTIFEVRGGKFHQIYSTTKKGESAGKRAMKAAWKFISLHLLKIRLRIRR